MCDVLLHVDHGHDYDADAFVERVVDRMTYADLDLESNYGRPSDVDRPEALFPSKAVVALLSETVPGGDIANVEQQFPAELDDCSNSSTPRGSRGCSQSSRSDWRRAAAFWRLQLYSRATRQFVSADS
ncbi:DUF2267 domain-containing protein [Natronorubrum texcoconense]|uniref:DUF2267 domain-containing protein n=1 Tax=Natronorubrum texcoconense TaxID=1095776 RepID=UPI001FDF1474|nr:DUF2267 domain-containing protein [Natronorubrum texcoconense]